jgi:hypothetical protein
MTIAPLQTPSAQTETISELDLAQTERANATGLTHVVFVHGLWLLSSNRDRWAATVEHTGCTALIARLARRSRSRTLAPKCSRAGPSSRGSR